MDDQQLWYLGNERLKGLLADLPVETGYQVTTLLIRYREAKEAVAAIVAHVDAASVCGECGGQCCLNGKYRINVFDTLARIAAHMPTSADFSQKPACPYGTDCGCTMEPGLRPADCVLFICDAIDQMLSPKARVILSEQEQFLRDCILELSFLIGEQTGTPLLLWAAKKVKSNSK